MLLASPMVQCSLLLWSYNINAKTRKEGWQESPTKKAGSNQAIVCQRWHRWPPDGSLMIKSPLNFLSLHQMQEWFCNKWYDIYICSCSAECQKRYNLASFFLNPGRKDIAMHCWWITIENKRDLFVVANHDICIVEIKIQHSFKSVIENKIKLNALIVDCRYTSLFSLFWS